MELRCLVEANPGAHSVVWRKDGSELIRSAEIQQLSHGGGNGNGGSILRLDRARRGDAGNYSCVAENLVGEGRSDDVELRVKRENRRCCHFFVKFSSFGFRVTVATSW